MELAPIISIVAVVLVSFKDYILKKQDHKIKKDQYVFEHKFGELLTGYRIGLEFSESIVQNVPIYEEPHSLIEYNRTVKLYYKDIKKHYIYYDKPIRETLDKLLLLKNMQNDPSFYGDLQNPFSNLEDFDEQEELKKVVEKAVKLEKLIKEKLNELD